MNYSVRIISIFHFLLVLFGTLLGVGYVTSEFLKLEESLLGYTLPIIIFIGCYKLAVKLTKMHFYWQEL
jgi:hypothetical protein